MEYEQDKTTTDLNRRLLNLQRAEIDNILPEYFGIDYPKFKALFDAYYEYMDSSGKPSGQIHDLYSSRDATQVPESLLKFLEDELLLGNATFGGFLNKREAIKFSNTQILDTRKTLPGLRLAQKYAVQIGGGSNHRIGLFDAFLIKENHIVAAGGIAEAISRARTMSPSLRLEIEVESLDELSEAIAAKPDWIMLDNFDNESLRRAVAMTPPSIKLEVSGGIENDDDIKRIAELGVDYISIGAMTKHIQATDLSLRMITTPSA